MQSMRALFVAVVIAITAGCTSAPEQPRPAAQPEADEIRPAAEGLVRLFEGTARVAGRGEERVLLGLYPDGSARLETAAPETPPFLQTGRWDEAADGLEVVLTGTRLIDFDAPVLLNLARTGDALVAARVDPDFFGAGPLRLEPAGTGTTVRLAESAWRLASLERDGVTYLPRAEGLYSIAFSEDGLLAGRADCNTVRTIYSDVGGRITTGPVMSTRVACPPGSLYDEFVALLTSARRYDVVDGELVLQGPDGSLRFAVEE